MKKGRVSAYTMKRLGLSGDILPRAVLAASVAKRLNVSLPKSSREQWALLAAFAKKGRGAQILPVRSEKLPKVARDGFLATYEWRRLRMVVLSKRGNRCECCGASPTDGHTVLHVDHVKPRKLFPHLALTESNLQILCSACNHGKGNWDQTDWRIDQGEELITLEDAARLADKFQL